MSKNDGGPAFPVEVTQYADGSYAGAQTAPRAEWCTGVSIRDYFAAAALTGLANIGNVDLAPHTPPILARDAYTLADAMLAERSKTEPSK